jgi:hypothetical protein
VIFPAPLSITFLYILFLLLVAFERRLGSKSSTIHVTGDPHKNTCGAGERPAMESGNTYWITAGSVFLILVRVHYKGSPETYAQSFDFGR